jgi:hypothetical protein
MSAPAKLALFALLLAVVFVVGVGLGALVDSGGTSSNPTHSGHAR